MMRLLLCTDMDRTIIPNGRQKEHPESRQRFRQLCELPGLILAYVTGRHLQLVDKAIADYDLPMADYAITDVGTKIYQRAEGKWHEMLSWQLQIAADWGGINHGQLEHELNAIAHLTLQEKNKQSTFKLSYYLPLEANQGDIITQVEDELEKLGVMASVIYSVDEPNHIGLLDILPRNATKLHGIEFLQHHLQLGRSETLFAGDSGNDLQVLASSIPSILVANAEPEIKRLARQLVEQNNCPQTLFLAQQEGYPLGGNYSAGVLQGVTFFVPEIGKMLNIT